MTTLELPWAAMLMANTLIMTDKADIEHNVVQWHSEGSTLFILCRGRQEIDLRLEREICPIQYQIAEKTHASSYIALTMMRSRPVLWAEGTEFDPGCLDRDTITLHFRMTPDIRDIYEKLTTFLAGNSSSDWATSLDVKQAQVMWEEKTAHLLGVCTNGDRQQKTDGTDRIIESSFGNLNADDVARLESGQWANDELINFSLNRLQFEILSSNPDRKMHVMSSFFYTKIAKDGYGSALPWVKDVDLLEMDFIIFPIHIVAHWLLVILDRPKYMVLAGARNSPKIYILDSLAHHLSPENIKMIFQYVLRFMHRVITDGKQALSGRKTAEIQVKVPQQSNGSDCGFFLIHFAKIFALHTKQCRKVIAERSDVVSDIWGLPSEIGEITRAEIKDYIKNHQNS